MKQVGTWPSGLFWLVFFAITSVAAIDVADAADSEPEAVILLYHRVAEEGPASTRVTPARFREHLDMIQQQGFTVLPVHDVLRGVYEGAPLPDKALALTFDDAYRSVGEAAFPLLRERKMPFSIFVATDRSDEGAGSFLSWTQMREMANSGLVTFGAHSLSHAHLEQWRDDQQGRRVREIEISVERVSAELGDAAIPVFAYPYGEYSRSTEAILSQMELYGLAQQSGAVGAQTPKTRIPRFPLYLGGDSDSRLMTALHARPMVAVGEAEQVVFFAVGDNPAATWHFEPAAGDFRREDIRCYAATGTALEQTFDGEAWSVDLPSLRPGRNKVNCTAKSTTGRGFYWYSRLWLLADEKGRWLWP